MKELMHEWHKADSGVEIEMELEPEFYQSWSFIVLSNIEISKPENIESLTKVFKIINDDCP